MIGLIGKILGREDALQRDAEIAYRALMDQARKKGFYGDARVPDSFQGRTELLMLHVAVVMKACLAHGEQGKLLQDAIFQRMRDDFDVALREVGYSDAGVKHRIKPMMKLFYQFVQQVFAALDDSSTDALLTSFEGADDVEGLGHAPDAYQRKLADYGLAFWQSAREMDLSAIASGDFHYPSLPR